MAIGLGTAILGSALIGGGAAVAGGIVQGNAATNAADAQVEAADRAGEIQREIYYDSADRLEPFRGLGVSAINPLADLLGLDYQTGGVTAAPANPNPVQTPGGASDTYRTPPGSGDPRDGYFGDGRLVDGPGPTTGAFLPGQSDPTQTPSTMYPDNGARPANPLAALRQTPGYEHRFSEGIRALDASAASRGMINSGSNIRGAIEYGQNFGTNEYDNQINRLLAVMGGGQVATNNTNAAASQYGQQAGNNALNAGNARASGYIGRGNATAGAIGGVTNNLLAGAGAYGGSQGWFTPTGV